MKSGMHQQQPASHEAIDWLFAKFTRQYGDGFTRKWDGIEDDVRQEWATGLTGFTAPEIRRGLTNLGTFPPNLPEFRRLCRPSIDPERAFYEALEQMRRRHDKGDDKWSSPVVYWAAVWVGGDLFSQPYPRLKARWEAALDQAQIDMAAGDVPATVPPKVPALPPPAQPLNQKPMDRWLREICVQTFMACNAGKACPYADEVQDLTWLHGKDEENIRPRVKSDGTFKHAGTPEATAMNAIIEKIDGMETQQQREAA